MKLRLSWYTGFSLLLAMALIAGCGGQPTCPDLQGTITSEAAGDLTPPGATPEATPGATPGAGPANFQTGTVKVTDGGDSFTWTADDTSYKAIDGVTVKGKIDQPNKNAPRNMKDAKADLSGDYKNCQLIVTGTLAGPVGDNNACQGSGKWQVVCNGTLQAGGSWSAIHLPKGAAGTPPPIPVAPQQPAPEPTPQQPAPQSPTTPQPPATPPPGGAQK